MQEDIEFNGESKKEKKSQLTKKQKQKNPYIFTRDGEIREGARNPSGLQIGLFITHKNPEIVHSDRFYHS